MTAGAGGVRRSRLSQAPILLLIVASIVLIALLDWGSTESAVLGLLMGLPVAMTASLDNRRWIWFVVLLALGSVLAVGWLGPASRADAAATGTVIAFDRLMALLVIGFSGILALILQQRRLEAERARDEAVSAGNLNRLLVALIAHDLRAPLVLADQALTYSYESAIRSEPGDPDLLAEVSARVGRSLRTIEGILAVARHNVNPARETPQSLVKQELAAELSDFERDGQEKGKVIDANLDALRDGPYPIDALVVRQVVGILVDNAVRYAPPGRIRVTARMEGNELVIIVADGGMVAPAEPPEKGGAGLGLELCRAIAANAGGSLQIERAEVGRTCTLRLPMMGATPAAGPAVPVVRAIRV